MVDFAVAIFSDIVNAATQMPIGGLVGQSTGLTIKAYLERRAAEQREVLLQELKFDTKAEWQVANADALLGAIFRFQRASNEGTGRRNLKLIARALRGTILSGDITPDRFNKYASILSDLTRTECFLLGHLHRACSDARSFHGSANLGPGNLEMWAALQNLTIPSLFPTAAHLTTVLAALQRTGFVIALTNVDLALQAYETSPQMDELLEVLGERGLEIEMD